MRYSEMAMLSDIKKVTNIQWGVVGSVVVGLAVFGGLVYAVAKLPSNSVTRPVKQAVDIVK
jgi:hypothetical protein